MFTSPSALQIACLTAFMNIISSRFLHLCFSFTQVCLFSYRLESSKPDTQWSSLPVVSLLCVAVPFVLLVSPPDYSIPLSLSLCPSVLPSFLSSSSVLPFFLLLPSFLSSLLHSFLPSFLPFPLPSCVSV